MIAFLVYANSFFNPFIWDDEQFIFKNVHVLTFDTQKLLTTSITDGAGILSNYYRPVLALSFAIDHAVWGLRPFGFHLTNTVLHAFSGVLLFLLFREIWPALAGDLEKKSRYRTFFSWLVALLFVVHPIQTESVTYMNSRGDSLYTFWLLIGLLGFAFSFRSTVPNLKLVSISVRITRSALLGFSLLAYLLSIFSKEIGLAGAGLFWLIGLAFLLRDSIQQKLKLYQRWQHITLLALVANMAFLYLWLRSTVLNFNSSFDFYDGQGVYAQSLVVRLLTFSKILWIYLRLLLVPFPLHMERTVELVTSFMSPWPWLALGFGVTVLWLSLQEWQRTKSIMILFGAGWFAIMLAPTSGIIPINGLLYEHWLYLPMVGFWLIILRLYLWVKELLPQKCQVRAQNRVPWFFMMYLSFLIILAWRQNYLWGDHVRFYTHTLKYAETARLHNNLAMAYSDLGQNNQAMAHYQKALGLAEYPQTHYNIANIYLNEQQLEASISHLLRSIELAPSFGFARNRLALNLLALEATDSAEYIATGSADNLLDRIAERNLVETYGIYNPSSE